MGVQKHVTKSGDGVTAPGRGDIVSIEYTGWLYDKSRPDQKGNRFDSSVGRGHFRTKIGVGTVIRGWDEGILGNSQFPAMTLGEKATLVVSSDYGYGQRGFPGHIPPNSDLVFDVELKGVGDKQLP